MRSSSRFQGRDFRVAAGLPSRRRFLRQAAGAAAFSVVSASVLGGGGRSAPNDRLTLAGIGTGGQGMQNLAALQEFPEVQVVAVCDVNREGGRYLSWNWTEGKEERLCGREPARRMVEEHYGRQERSGAYRGCRAYSDYRELLEKEDVDAVMVATPDHTHAVIGMAALKRKKHLYCEKPLAHTVYEARQMTEAARAAGVATQMGNQGQAGEAARVVCEMIADGAIGAVREVQVWCSARFWTWPTWEGRPPERPPVPEGLDWDSWLGPAPERPYHPAYHPWTWRNWWDFGTGQLGDLGCHKLSTVFKALQLGHPVSVEASSTRLGSEIYPLGVMARFEFPAKGGLPPVVLSWYDGGLRPPRPPELDPDDPLQDTIYIGENGKIMGDRLLPETRMEGYKRPPKTLARSPGHYHEWVAACRGGAAAGSDFVNHAGLLTEACLLGNAAVRAQRKLAWDGSNLRFPNAPEANRWLHRPYRPGWTL
ncbi:MAG TPA: Gfo/Idh/MocA family oxidoreductase [Verrucomicrobiota bacterium]|nr:Gfo/Idh/MocA family oxidoreductase [Verrucomicrobiota bacterium]HNU51546.1 Gfo/Idh/MocA family oxidoreductase [Verrucomicrobiota bacterium]